MSTNLSGNILTLGGTSLNEDRLKIITEYKNATVNVGDTVYLDGIECLCVATGVTIQGSTLTRIAVDKNHDLGYYQNYVGTVLNGTEISNINFWRWGGYGTSTGNTSKEIGYRLNNTLTCLAKTVNYTAGSSTTNNTYPLMWIGVNDFRSFHSDKWFVPSRYELNNYVYANKSSLSFDTSTGGSSANKFWSSSEADRGGSYYLNFSDGSSGNGDKYRVYSVRLCRAF